MTEEQLTAYKDKVNQAQSILQKIQGYAKLPVTYRQGTNARVELLRYLSTNNPYLTESDIAEILTKALEKHVEFLITEAHKELQVLWEGPADPVKKLEKLESQAKAEVLQRQDKDRHRVSEAGQAIISNPANWEDK